MCRQPHAAGEAASRAASSAARSGGRVVTRVGGGDDEVGGGDGAVLSAGPLFAHRYVVFYQRRVYTGLEEGPHRRLHTDVI